MKNIAALIIGFVVIFTLTSCGGGGLKSVDDTKKILEEKGYKMISAKDQAGSEEDMKKNGVVDGISTEDEAEDKIFYAEFADTEKAEAYLKKLIGDTGGEDFFKDGKDGLSGTHKVVDIGPVTMNMIVKEKYLFVAMNVKQEDFVKIAKDIGF